MLQTPRVTVWSSIDDLRHLKSLLYENTEYNGRPRALEIIRAWSTRGRLPHAIESTAQLTECVLHDTPQQSELMVRMAYSTAICRFVNGLLDPAQKSHFAVSMYSLAQELELPASFVDIRHAATHEALPPLGVLRTTCSRAFDWLWVHYWDRIDASGGVVEVGGKPEKGVDQAQISRVQGLLDRWEAINARSHAQQRQGAKRKDDRDEALLCAELADIFKESTDNAILLEILVHEHFLVMEENSSHVDGFASGLFDTVLEAIQEVEDTDAENRDEFAESESEYTYQWLEFLVSLLMKGQLAVNNASLLDDVVSQCLRLAEYAIGQSSLLESKYSQACTMTKKQLTVDSKQATNLADYEKETRNRVVPVGSDDGMGMDLDQELDEFEVMLKIMQTRREQWGTNKKSNGFEEGSGNLVGPENSVTSKLTTNGKRAAIFCQAGPEWSPKPIGVA
ncbi:hypothetical protein AA313_de0202080 [Arthrobotrys entomopaga]|nr:hypothetical protein AA313_de0202080 [Arthrobotrys entomopaga]